MKVYFLRHGQTDYNVKNIINQDKKIKVSFNSYGRKQAKKVAEKFRKIKFDIILSSEFLRARQTAEIINEYHGVLIKTDKRINEIKIGFEGKSANEHEAAYEKDPFYFKLPGKESWQDLKIRIKDFLNDLKKKKYDFVLVVTHQWPGRVANEIINKLTDEEAFYVPFDTCDYFEFDI